ncbi:resistance protein [Musa troglodytarum]|uniref:Resistance protein n=1 Tax=Musa troglodytarum TaxID=320322 RepID=A0A9E7LET3_9LILI|nr:resistance protein [Musa troglodytarum]
MSNLRKLSGYAATGSCIDIISELRTLSNLEELHLQNLEAVSNQEDSTAPTPSKLQDILGKLKCLSLQWKWWNTDDVEAASEAISLQVLENLQPDTCLRKLEITCYAGKEFPGWIGEGVRYFQNLNEIKLVNLRRCETLPPLGQLRNLKILEMSGMDLVTVVDDAFYGGSDFEMLEKLIFSEMPRLEEWLKPTVVSYVHRYGFSIRLRELALIQCPKLRKLEPQLYVDRLNIWLNNEMLWTSEFLDWKHINAGYGELTLVGCQELRCLPQEMRYLGDLKRLTVISCNELVSLPDWLPKSRSLETVIISSCVEMSSIPEGVEQLRGLTVNGCPKLRL